MEWVALLLFASQIIPINWAGLALILLGLLVFRQPDAVAGGTGDHPRLGRGCRDPIQLLCESGVARFRLVS